MGSITIISVPKSRNIVWYRRIHDKINFAITVIPIAVHWRVKYEQKSRYRYHVYVNLLSKIDEQDVTNIRSLISPSLSSSLSYIAASEYTSAVSTRSALMRFASICFHLEIRVASIFSIYWMHHVAWYRFSMLVRWSSFFFRSLCTFLIPLVITFVLFFSSSWKLHNNQIVCI